MKYLVPEQIETKNLTLRQFQSQDWQALHEYFSDISATKYTVGKAFSETETWNKVCGMLGHWQIRGYGPYAVVEKATTKVVGLTGFWFPIDWPSPEITWALVPKHWGKGIASEAARAVQKIGTEYLPDIDFISLIHQQNTSSIQLAKAVGAKFEKSMVFRGEDFDVYRHPK